MTRVGRGNGCPRSVGDTDAREHTRTHMEGNRDKRARQYLHRVGTPQLNPTWKHDVAWVSR